MRTGILSLVILFAVCVSALSQQEARISTPELSYFNDTLLIVFDINNCEDQEIFTIDPKIFTSNGSMISANSLSGDLGENIKCGKNKRIIWSLAADQFKVDDDIEVQIFANQVIINMPEQVETEKPVSEDKVETGDDKTPSNRIEDSSYSSFRPVSRGNIMASSLLFPGLGQKKASRKGGHLLLGVLGYGALATSGYFLYDYDKKYDQYLASDIQYYRDLYFDQAEKSYKTSKYFLYGAAGIWTVNLIWSAIIPSSSGDNFASGILPSEYSGIQLYARWTF